MGRPKKAAQAPPIMENEHVKELLSIMQANNLPAAKDLLAILRQVGAMESQLDAAVNELQSMRRELETMREESHPIKTALQNAVKTLEKNIAAMRERLDELKANIIDGCKNAVTAFKEKGLSALRNIVDFFKIRPGLEAMQDALNKCIRQDERAIVKIEAISAEYNEAGRLIKNIGRAMVEKAPPGSPCRDCGYWRGMPCVGICYRDLTAARKEDGTCGQIVHKCHRV